MTEEEKSKAWNALPKEITECMTSLSFMSDSWSRDLHEILSAVLWDRDVKKLFKLKQELADKVDKSIAIAKDESRLSTVPKDVLEELIRDLKQIDQWKWKVERMLSEALEIQRKSR